MEGPSDALRRRIGEGLSRIEDEAALSDLLGVIQGELARDSATGFGQESEQLLVAVDAWAGLASHVIARFYAPASPWRRFDLAGWGQGAITRLRDIGSSLALPLGHAAKGSGAVSWTISVGFPWGISIGITWA
jgi:hypothetical protein